MRKVKVGEGKVRKRKMGKGKVGIMKLGVGEALILQVRTFSEIAHTSGHRRGAAFHLLFFSLSLSISLSLSFMVVRLWSTKYIVIYYKNFVFLIFVF